MRVIVVAEANNVINTACSAEPPIILIAPPVINWAIPMLPGVNLMIIEMLIIKLINPTAKNDKLKPSEIEIQ